MNKENYKVSLTRSDNKIFWWIFKSLKKAKECVQDYADRCPYECEWLIWGNGKELKGSTIGRDK